MQINPQCIHICLEMLIVIWCLRWQAYNPLPHIWEKKKKNQRTKYPQTHRLSHSLLPFSTLPLGTEGGSNSEAGTVLTAHIPSRKSWHRFGTPLGTQSTGVWTAHRQPEDQSKILWDSAQARGSQVPEGTARRQVPVHRHLALPRVRSGWSQEKLKNLQRTKEFSKAVRSPHNLRRGGADVILKEPYRRSDFSMF